MRTGRDREAIRGAECPDVARRGAAREHWPASHGCEIGATTGRRGAGLTERPAATDRQNGTPQATRGGNGMNIVLRYAGQALVYVLFADFLG